MLNIRLCSVPEIIYSQAVLVFIYLILQLLSEKSELCGVHNALKHGILNSHSIVHTLLGNSSETLPAFLILSIHIICHKYQHIITST